MKQPANDTNVMRLSVDISINLLIIALILEINGVSVVETGFFNEE